MLKEGGREADSSGNASFLQFDIFDIRSRQCGMDERNSRLPPECPKPDFA